MSSPIIFKSTINSIRQSCNCRSVASKGEHHKKQHYKVVKLDEVRRFLEDCLIAVGAPKPEAKAHADLLLHADIVGHHSHGLNRIGIYINGCKNGVCVPSATPEVVKQSAATAWVDGHLALGSTVSSFCMDLAIKKAKECGVGWVSAKRSNHNGMLGYWAQKAERAGLIGLVFSNTPPVTVPTRSKQRALGTNPIAMAVPAACGDRFVVDMATAAAAMGKLEMQDQKGEPLPAGWALGPDGKPTTDAKPAMKAGLLMPLGGSEKTAGYKGYCLGAMVEILCSGLAGSTLGHNVEMVAGCPKDLSQCFIAVNPNCFAPEFLERAAELLCTWRNLEPVDKNLPVLVPGDKERDAAEKTLARGTIAYPLRQITPLEKLAAELTIDPLVFDS